VRYPRHHGIPIFGARTNLGGNVEISIAASNLLYAFFGLILMFVGYWLFDRITPHIHFQDELGKGNMAVAMVISALFISLAYVIGRSLN
jgi:uncharacterized membrane protein YjfL (UPF0719 family)